VENDVQNAKLTDENKDFRAVFSALRDLATELWDAAERLEAAYGVVVDALNETCPCDEGMLVLITKPGYYAKVGGNNAA
jgi:hypothetical protein